MPCFPYFCVWQPPGRRRIWTIIGAGWCEGCRRPIRRPRTPPTL